MSDAPLLRPATPADAAALTAIADEAYGVYLPRMPQGVRPRPMDTDYALAIAQREVWVAELHGRVSGYVILDAARDHLLLENVAVRRETQGQGVGRALLALAEDRAAGLGLPAVRLYTHVTMVENQRLYTRVGYIETRRSRERVFYEKRVPAAKA